jgi:hypothetical protein
MEEVSGQNRGLGVGGARLVFEGQEGRKVRIGREDPAGGLILGGESAELGDRLRGFVVAKDDRKWSGGGERLEGLLLR